MASLCCWIVLFNHEVSIFFLICYTEVFSWACVIKILFVYLYNMRYRINNETDINQDFFGLLVINDYLVAAFDNVSLVVHILV